MCILSLKVISHQVFFLGYSLLELLLAIPAQLKLLAKAYQEVYLYVFNLSPLIEFFSVLYYLDNNQKPDEEKVL